MLVPVARVTEAIAEFLDRAVATGAVVEGGADPALRTMLVVAARGRPSPVMAGPTSARPRERRAHPGAERLLDLRDGADRTAQRRGPEGVHEVDQDRHEAQRHPAQMGGRRPATLSWSRCVYGLHASSPRR